MQIDIKLFCKNVLLPGTPTLVQYNFVLVDLEHMRNMPPGDCDHIHLSAIEHHQ